MAKPNYSFEKRQRELAKQRKQEEKRQKKAARTADATGTAPAEPQADGDKAPPAAS